MKNTWIVIALGCLCFTAIVTSCKTASHKANATQTNDPGNVGGANADAGYAAEVAQFRTDASTRLANNTKEIATVMASANKASHRLATSAEKENNSLKKRLAAYKNGTRQAYAQFKSGMTRDMAALDTRIHQMGGK